MNEEKILEYLGNLTNGALNYYKSSTEIMIMQSSIKNYINQLQQENQQLKQKLEHATKVCVAEHRHGSNCQGRIIECEYALNEIRKIIIRDTTNRFTGEELGESINIEFHDILQIIDKVLGDEK